MNKIEDQFQNYDKESYNRHFLRIPIGMRETACVIENYRFTGRITWQRVHEGRSHTGVIPIRYPGGSSALRATGFTGFSSDLVQRGSVVSIREATGGRSLLASR